MAANCFNAGLVSIQIIENLTFSTLIEVLGISPLQVFDLKSEIKHLITDSRKVSAAANGLFFAISGVNHDGHDFVLSLYNAGVRNFIVEKEVEKKRMPEANILKVAHTTKALQGIAKYHKKSFDIPVLAITGSNGKTIVKEWLSQMLSVKYQITKSPKSFNSQIGVPLSLWQLDNKTEIGVFEAGISKPGEMSRLKEIIQPTSGLITNIGTAHQEGFASLEEKTREKLSLFEDCETVYYCRDHQAIDTIIREAPLKAKKTFTWSIHREADVMVNQVVGSTVSLQHEGTDFSFDLPFTDNASIENLMHCITFLIHQKFEPTEIQKALDQLEPVSMRLELKKGIHQTYLINDAYNNDLAGLKIALDFMANQHQRSRKTVILSDIPQSGMQASELYQQVNTLLNDHRIDRLIGIGHSMTQWQQLFTLPVRCFQTTDEFLSELSAVPFEKELILIKGARSFAFERIVQQLTEKIHQTALEINLNALTDNLNFYRSRLNPGTKVMVVIKALAYGSGGAEVANLLQFHKVDYLAVAYSDEGIALRENGIHLPIMVMNPSEEDFERLIQYELEPEVYSMGMLHTLIRFMKSRDQKLPVHLNLNTGMNRLGFEPEEVDTLCHLLASNQSITIASLFTHLAGADEQVHQEYSMHQLTLAQQLFTQIEDRLGTRTIRHALNSAGILRFPGFQMDMVRLGIGLHGIEVNGTTPEELTPVSSLKTVISQVRNVKKGETIGYGRQGKADKEMTVATIAIGYADGYSRAFSNGVGKVLVHDKLAPVIGNVCMDMTMIDITGIEANAGDEVVIFGQNPSILSLAKSIHTIPYEILTNVSERVKRVFYAE